MPLYYVRHPLRYEISYERGETTVADIHIDGMHRRGGREVDRAAGRDAAGARVLALGGRRAQPLVRVAAAGACSSCCRSWTRGARSACSTSTCSCCSAFGVSEYFFNKGNVDVSVPLVYPLLGYLLIRLALAGFRPRPRGERLMPYARTSWLVVGLVLLMVFRVGLNVSNSVIMDVGYASVIGADRITTKQDLYVDNDIHGDTYGPITYLAYVPFELLFPNDGDWGEVPAAHAAVARLRPRHRDRPDAARHPAAIGRGGPQARRGAGLRLDGLSRSPCSGSRRT